ncbi:DUF397 domain-containing protein [Streptomyces sp. NPDC101112]|uniref:DUF397 domain-containing protein n=1 Tax=Streptomyces sp. NPDC101112 TaxID=3366105 RepID=UPI00380930EE
MPIRSEHQWFKSSYSRGSGTECVEAASVLDGCAVRDSKDLSGPRLSFSSEACDRLRGGRTGCRARRCSFETTRTVSPREPP